MANPIERITSKGQLVQLLFTEDGLADAQSAVAMKVVDPLGAAEHKVPFDGEIVAVSVLSDSARTAGTATFDATVNGTVTGLTAVLNATDTTHKHTTQARGSDKFVAGDRVGCKVTTASWTPIAADVTVSVWVLLYLDGIGRTSDS